VSFSDAVQADTGSEMLGWLCVVGGFLLAACRQGQGATERAKPGTVTSALGMFAMCVFQPLFTGERINLNALLVGLLALAASAPCWAVAVAFASG
jgi:hypothetical protein